MSDQDTQPIPVPAEGESHKGNTGEIKPPTRGDGEQQPEEPNSGERSSAGSDERKRD